MNMVIYPIATSKNGSNHSLSQSGHAIYSLRPSTLAQWQYGYHQAQMSQVNRTHESKGHFGNDRGPT